MPFVAQIRGEQVLPEEVEDSTEVKCIECAEAMYPRGPFADGRARHFVHESNTACEGGGGESNTHARLKSIAVSTLKQAFADQLSQCAPEVALSTQETETLPETRYADALAEFQSENRYYGKGVIIEVQYRNHSKDKFATTHDYLSLGYSVFWAEPADFSEESLPFDVVESTFSDPEDNRGIAIYDNGPSDFSTDIESSLEWNDPHPSCEHEWKETKHKRRQYQSCPWCGTNKRYSESRTRFLYDNYELLGPSVEPPPDVCNPNDGHRWERYEEHVFRCAKCGYFQLGSGFPQSDVLLSPDHDMYDLSELTSNPQLCPHFWSGDQRGSRCTACGLRNIQL